MTLTQRQQLQIENQMRHHQHGVYQTDIELTEGAILRDFSVHANVMRSEVMTSLYAARWLFFNNGLYNGKTVHDIGTGSGLQGIVAGISGAKRVIFSDIADACVANAGENVKKYNLEQKSLVVKGDLFENVPENADVIIFNQPYFADESEPQFTSVRSSMVSKGDLIHRFFDGAKQFLNPNGNIIMSYFDIASPENDPKIQAPQHGYTVLERFAFDVKTGLQQGICSVYEIRRR